MNNVKPCPFCGEALDEIVSTPLENKFDGYYKHHCNLLSNEEIIDIANKSIGALFDEEVISLARAIEVKIREKNNENLLDAELE